MTISEPAPFDPTALVLGSDLRRTGLEPARAGLHHVRQGVWVAADTWAYLPPEQRHAALVHATDLCRDDGAIYCCTAAAAVWGLPRVGPWPTSVHGHITGTRIRGSDVLTYHVAEPAATILVNGVSVTSPARTIIDLARRDTLATAVAAADAALRRGLCTRDELSAEVAAIPRRHRGRAAAALVRDLADPGSMSPGESLSRVQMYLLRLPRPRLQAPHDDAHGRIGVVDFDWAGVIGEFDGKIKYRIPEGATPQEASEILWREKRREDRLRRIKPVCRWVWHEALDQSRLAKVLAAYGMRPLPRNRWFD